MSKGKKKENKKKEIEPDDSTERFYRAYRRKLVEFG
jgi:hypothetical protein